VIEGLMHNRGGKLIMYHGWADQGIPPLGTLAYYAALDPQEATVYSGSGSIDDATNFTEVCPHRYRDDHIDWVGKNLYNRKSTDDNS
jgi:hypothetical protein